MHAENALQTIVYHLALYAFSSCSLLTHKIAKTCHAVFWGIRFPNPQTLLRNPEIRFRNPGTRLRKPGTRVPNPGTRLQKPDTWFRNH